MAENEPPKAFVTLAKLLSRKVKRSTEVSDPHTHPLGADPPDRISSLCSISPARLFVSGSAACTRPTPTEHLFLASESSTVATARSIRAVLIVADRLVPPLQIFPGSPTAVEWRSSPPGNERMCVNIQLSPVVLGGFDTSKQLVKGSERLELVAALRAEYHAVVEREESKLLQQMDAIPSQQGDDGPLTLSIPVYYFSAPIKDNPRSRLENIADVCIQLMAFMSLCCDTSMHSLYAKNWTRLADAISPLLAPRPGVLVHCMAGVSRSPSIILAFLMTQFGLDFEETLEKIRAFRPQVCPNPSFAAELACLCRHLASRPSE